jgi:hypothetical protein
METNQNKTNDSPIRVKLYVAKIPRTADKKQFVEPFAKHGQILDAFLSKPSSDGEKNGGWGILVVNRDVATILLRETILIGDDIVEVRAYVPQTPRSETRW